MISRTLIFAVIIGTCGSFQPVFAGDCDPIRLDQPNSNQVRGPVQDSPVTAQEKTPSCFAHAASHVADAFLHVNNPGTIDLRTSPDFIFLNAQS
jgi:hypothetical protein